MAGNIGFVRGEILDILFGTFDKDTLDETLDDQMNEATDDLMIQEKTSTVFHRTTCSKVYKTRGSLNAHARKKHDVNIDDPSEASAAANNDLKSSYIINLV